jgi:hypothetical protein
MGTLQFIAVGDFECKVIKPDSPFVQGAWLRLVVRHDRLRDAAALQVRNAVGRFVTRRNHERESHDVLPPLR